MILKLEQLLKSKDLEFIFRFIFFLNNYYYKLFKFCTYHNNCENILAKYIKFNIKLI